MRPKTNTLISRAAMMLLMMLLTTTTAWADVIDTYYVDANGTRHDVTATVLTGSETSLAAGTYVVNSNITYTGTITLTGDVIIILGDGKTMTVNSVTCHPTRRRAAA